MGVTAAALSSFFSDLDKEAQKVRDEATEFVHRLCKSAYVRIVARNPVDTGFSRSYWQATTGRAPTGDIVPPRDRGSFLIPLDQARADAFAAIDASKIGDIISIFNRVTYVEFLEAGSSQQAPNGMVQITLDELALRYPSVQQASEVKVVGGA